MFLFKFNVNQNLLYLRFLQNLINNDYDPKNINMLKYLFINKKLCKIKV